VEIPQTFEEKCEKLKQLFRVEIQSTIQMSDRSIQTWETCLRHPTLDFSLDVTLVFGEANREAEHRKSFTALDSFARHLTHRIWMFGSQDMRVLHEVVHKERPDPFLVVLIRQQPKSRALVRVPGKERRKGHEISANDKRFLRSLRIACPDEDEEIE